MKNLTFYLIVIIVVLTGLTFTFYNLNKKHKQDSIRWESNFNETKETLSQLDLSLHEFKKSITNKTDSILKEARIKPKNVTQITNYNSYYTDTTITEKTLVFDTKTGTYPFIDKQGCFEFEGFIDLNDSLPMLNVENRKFNQDLTEIEFYKKDTIQFLGLNLVKWWQKKRLDYTVIDNCTGKQIIHKTNIK